MNNLERAAYEFSMIKRQIESAISCSVPTELINTLINELNDCRKSLEQEAEEFFDDVYDGGIE